MAPAEAKRCLPSTRSWPAPLLAAFLAASCRGEAPSAGVPAAPAVPAAVVAGRDAAQADAARRIAARAGAAEPAGTILFGDLHVHTAFSSDAFAMNLPVLQGEGVPTAGDACDFARHCSAIDFWALTDHAESLTPGRWRESAEAMRSCESAGGREAAGDVVPFLGWEWTQIGLRPDEHHGHRNVVLRGLGEGDVPRRPVAASDFSGQVLRDKLPWPVRWLLPLLDWRHRGTYLDFLDYWRETREADECPPGVDPSLLPGDCMDFVRTPRELFERLRSQRVDALVIPHGTSWGLYTPPAWFPGPSLRKGNHDPDYERLVEVFSGDGNAEESRPWKEGVVDEDGRLACPPPSGAYVPCCWQAGEIVRSHCEDPGAPDCEARVEEARRNHLAAGAWGRRTLPGAAVEEWGDCGQCPDCFAPPFEHRPGGSVQYALATTHFDERGGQARYRYGFVGSSDNHSGRPGAGYKEFGRGVMSDTFGPRSAFWHERTRLPLADAGRSQPVDPKNNRFQRFQILDFERGTSVAYTGGLVAVHARGRDRAAIWEALQERRTYATSGERILLWFDLVRGGGAMATMGSGVDWQGGAPRFVARAVGSPEQLPGCPPSSVEALGEERVATLCGGECWNPGGRRRRIVRLEVVRIRPQARPGEPVAGLIDDPWRTFECDDDGSGCAAEFVDEEFARSRRDALYYVRAVQEASPAVGAGGLRCKGRDSEGRCLGVEPCFGDWRTPADDDCLAPQEERAWSSPITVAWKDRPGAGYAAAGAAEAMRSRSSR